MTAVVKYKTSTKDTLIECTEGTVTNVLNLSTSTGATNGSTMTISPEAAAESGFLTLLVDGVSVQVPFYNA